MVDGRPGVRVQDEERVRGIRKVTLDLNKEYLHQLDVIKSVNDGMVKSTKATVNEITQAFEKLADNQAKAVESSRNAQAGALGRIGEINRDKGTIDFRQRTAALSDAQKAFALAKRATELSRSAAATLGNAAGDQKKLNLATQQFRDAQQIAGELTQAFDRFCAASTSQGAS